MTFHLLTLADRSVYENAVAKSPLFADYMGSEANFQNLFVWKRFDAIECGVLESGAVVARGIHGGVPFYFPPVAASETDFVAALDVLEKDAVARNVPFFMRGLTARLADVAIRSGRRYRVDTERSLFEYLYDSAALRTLAGNKYHAKRNFLNRFFKNGDYVFRPYEASDRITVETMLSRWQQHKLQRYELETILEVLDHLAAVGCFADLLFVADRLAAFAIGTFTGPAGLVLFEKADTGFPGVYAAINYLFANKHYAGVSLINRQEDLGIPELRKAKMSYNPVGFVEKQSLMRDHLSSAEVAELRSLHAEAFPQDAPTYIDYFFRQKYRADNVVFRKHEGHIVSALHLIPKTFLVHGKSFPVPYIAAAATLTAWRGRGLMTAIVAETLADFHDRGVAVCALAPFRESFYAAFGFTTVSRAKATVFTVPPGDGRTYRVATKEDLTVLDSLYRRKTEGYDVFIDRKLDAWEAFHDEVAADGGEIVIVAEAGEPIGYYTRFGDNVEEACFPDDSALTSVSALDGKTVCRPGGPADASNLMIRIVDVVRFLTEYPYAPETNFVRHVKIADPFFPPNKVAIAWSVAAGVADVREIDDADDTLTITKLTAMAFCDGAAPFLSARTLVFDRY